MRNIHDLAELVGYEVLDREFLSWLESDRDLSRSAVSTIRRNYPELLPDHERLTHANEILQAAHREAHPDGPWGFEFCARCGGMA